MYHGPVLARAGRACRPGLGLAQGATSRDATSSLVVPHEVLEGECLAGISLDPLHDALAADRVVVGDGVDLDKINVGCAVKVYDITFDEEMEFKIVGSTEANSLEGKISNESPVGQALIGKKINDVVDVETQAGVIQYKVLDIKRS